MITTLSDNDLAKLHARFILPIIVDRMLHDEEDLDDVAEQAMNEMLDEFRPDTALICIALCARHVAAHVGNINAANALVLETEKIVNEYAPVWLKYDAGREVPDEAEIHDILRHIPEDFEALAHILEAIVSELDEDHAIPAILSDILCMQSYQHMEKAEQDLAPLASSENLSPGTQYPRAGQSAASEGEGNVITFPGVPAR